MAEVRPATHRPAAGVGQGRRRERFSTVEIQKVEVEVTSAASTAVRAMAVEGGVPKGRLGSVTCGEAEARDGWLGASPRQAGDAAQSNRTGEKTPTSRNVLNAISILTTQVASFTGAAARGRSSVGRARRSQ